MLKNKKVLVLLAAIVFMIIFIVIFTFLVNNDDNNDNKLNEANKIEGQQLGNYSCLALFNVARKNPYISNKEVFEIDYFQSFSGGAFSGKIKNFKPEQKSEFPVFINELIKEAKISTYEHLEANVCLYNEDMNNPPGGIRLDYYVEHRYCTNNCHTGKYEIEVELQSNGQFIGYRQNISK